MEEARTDSKKPVLVDMAGFRDLYVWREGKALALEVFRITQEGVFAADNALRDQVRRAAIRVPSNIAEGDERESGRDAIRFLMIARGSLAKLWTQLEIANELRYIDDETMQALAERCHKLRRMLSGLIQARTQLL